MTETVTTTDMIALVAENPAIVLTDAKAYAAWKAMVIAESAKAGTDVSTTRGRDAIRTAARKVASSKTAIDAARKGLTEEYRAKVKTINEIGMAIVDEVAQIAADVRKPLTDYEAAEKAREDAAQALFERLKVEGTISLDDTSTTVRDRLATIEALTVDAETYGDFADAAKDAWNKTTTEMGLAIERLTQQEADRAELEAMRAAHAQRLADEEAAKIAAERAAREAEEAALAEKRAQEAREAEAKRVAEAAEAARLVAIAEAEQKAAADLKAQADAHAAELARVEREAQAERERLAAAERNRQAEEAETARVEAARQANRAHRAKVMGAAKEALIQIEGVDEFAAVAIVKAIVAGTIPAVSIAF